MQVTESLDQQALIAAKQYMGQVAWPTVVLGLVIICSYLAVPALVVGGEMSLLLALPAMAFLTYGAYTVLHDAAHGSISGSNRSLRWLNDALGYAMGWILMIPLTAHRHEHLAHHRHTNQPEGDPDYVVAGMGKSPLHAAWAALRIACGQLGYYRRHRWGKGPRSQDIYLCLEMVAAFVPRLAFLAMGFWVEGALMFGLAWLVGIAALLYLFAYIVHTPHEAVGRWVDTSTFVAEGPWGKVVTALWGYQNYHSIHHLFPRVPFYRYCQLFEEIEHIMIAKGAPIYHLQKPLRDPCSGRADEAVPAGLKDYQ